MIRYSLVEAFQEVIMGESDNEVLRVSMSTG